MNNKIEVNLTPSINKQGKTIGLGEIVVPFDVPGVVIAAALVVKGGTQIVKEIDNKTNKCNSTLNEIKYSGLNFRSLNVEENKDNKIMLKLPL